MPSKESKLKRFSKQCKNGDVFYYTSTMECVLQNTELQMQADNGTVPLVSFKLSDIPQDSSTAIKYFELIPEKYGMPGDYSGVLQYRFVCEPIAD